MVPTDSVEQKGDVRKGCSLSPYLFNTFIDNTDYISKGNPHTPTGRTVPGLFADALATE
jgi:hypothetical protein